MLFSGIFCTFAAAKARSPSPNPLIVLTFMKQEIAGYCVAAIAAISSAQAIEGLKVSTNHSASGLVALTLSTKSSRELSLIDWRLTRELDKLATQYALCYFIQPLAIEEGLEILMI